MIKTAGMEETQVTDPKTGLPVRISTSTRIMFRYIFRNNPELGYSNMRNERLNQIIAESYSESSDKVVHHFKLKSSNVDGMEQDIGEIRNMSRSAMFFITRISGGTADILVLQPAYRPPKYKKEEQV